MNRRLQTLLFAATVVSAAAPATAFAPCDPKKDKKKTANVCTTVAPSAPSVVITTTPEAPHVHAGHVQAAHPALVAPSAPTPACAPSPVVSVARTASVTAFAPTAAAAPCDPSPCDPNAKAKVKADKMKAEEKAKAESKARSKAKTKAKKSVTDAYDKALVERLAQVNEQSVVDAHKMAQEAYADSKRSYADALKSYVEALKEAQQVAAANQSEETRKYIESMQGTARRWLAEARLAQSKDQELLAANLRNAYAQNKLSGLLNPRVGGDKSLEQRVQALEELARERGHEVDEDDERSLEDRVEALEHLMRKDRPSRAFRLEDGRLRALELPRMRVVEPSEPGDDAPERIDVPDVDVGPIEIPEIHIPEIDVDIPKIRIPRIHGKGGHVIVDHDGDDDTPAIVGWGPQSGGVYSVTPDGMKKLKSWSRSSDDEEGDDEEEGDEDADEEEGEDDSSHTFGSLFRHQAHRQELQQVMSELREQLEELREQMDELRAELSRLPRRSSTR